MHIFATNERPRWGSTFLNRLLRQELGYLPLPNEAASALFQVVSQRYLKSSIVLTTNRPVGSWGEILGDTTVAAALLDRLLHRCVVLTVHQYAAVTVDTGVHRGLASLAGVEVLLVDTVE